MRKLFIPLLCCLVLVSCKSRDKFQNKIIDHNRKILEAAFVTGDINTAITSINAILIYDTANFGLLDTLSSLYMQLEDHGSAYRTSVKLMQIDEDNLQALEKYASNAAKLNLSNDAYIGYSKLYEKVKSTSFLYEMGVQKYNLGEVEAGASIMNSIINTPESLTDIYLVRVRKNQFIQIPVIAMVYYFLASFEEIQGKKAEAIELYNKSLEFAPGFFKAAEKLELLGR